MARLHAKYRKDKQGRRVLQSYYAEFYDAQRRPRQKRISLLTRDKTAARLKLAEMEREYMAGLRDPWTDASKQEGVTVHKAVDHFLKDRARAANHQPLPPIAMHLCRFAIRWLPASQWTA